jgi:hypothetical protein
MLLKSAIVTSTLLLATAAFAQTSSQSSPGASSNAPGQQMQNSTKPSTGPGASEYAPGHQTNKAGPGHSESAPGQQPTTTGSGSGSSSGSATKR